MPAILAPYKILRLAIAEDKLTSAVENLVFFCRKHCRYYKGEETNPYRYHKNEKERYIACFWEAEMRCCIHSNKSYFINEEYISMMSDCSPEIRHITKDKTLPIEVRGMIAFAIDDLTYHSPMTDTSYFEHYGKI